jgi:TRAP transporter 4TM/12TM fusion protein
MTEVRNKSNSIAEWVATLILISLSIFQIYIAIVGVMTPLVQRSIFLSFGLPAAFLVYGVTKKRRPGAFSLLLGIMSAFVAIYPTLNFKFMSEHAWLVEPLGGWDLLVGALAIILILEATRRCAGLPFTLLCSLFLVYPCAPLLTGPIYGFPGYSPNAVIDWMYFTLEGVFGVSIGVSTTTIFHFVLLGSFLEKVGITEFFLDMANTLVGSRTGGPAKVAVISSAAIGTVSGSAVANVLITGQFTIPTMIKTGYPREFAGAVESVASTGGYITPPVMGGVAFLMAEIIGVSYWTIALHSMIPAVFYYTATFAQVHLRACKLGLRGIPKDQLPSYRLILKRIYYLFPLGLLVFLLSSGYSPSTSSFGALVASVLIGFIFKKPRLKISDILSALKDGAKTALLIIITCTSAGFILGSLSLTGLGILLSSAISNISGGILCIVLLLSMFVNLLMGMGVGSPIASYLTLVGTTVPLMIQLGVNPIAAHIFTLYYANIAFITPPVAMAVFAASALAKSSIWKTGWIAVRLGIVGFLIPYMFAINPALILIGSVPDILWAIFTAGLGIISLSGGIEGWFFGESNWLQRGVMIIGGCLLIVPEVVTDIIGAMLFTAGIILNYFHTKRVAGGSQGKKV